MKKLLIVGVIILALVLGASIYFCVIFNQDKNALTANLKSTQNVLASTQTELASITIYW
jgi:sensor domain CHASE-containing protein